MTTWRQNNQYLRDMGLDFIGKEAVLRQNLIDSKDEIVVRAGTVGTVREISHKRGKYRALVEAGKVMFYENFTNLTFLEPDVAMSSRVAKLQRPRRRSGGVLE